MSWRGPTWLRHTGLPVARLPGVLPPTTWRGKQQLKSRLPGFPVARVSPAFREFPPGRSSALAMNEFVLRLGELAQGFLASNFKIFLVIREIHKKARVIPRERRLSTTLSTAWSTGRSLGRLARNEGRLAMTPVHAASIRRSGAGQAVVAYGRECRTRSEAPPRMRWRGLAAAIQQGYRLLGYRGCCTVAPPGRENQPGAPVSRLSTHPPRRSGFPVRRSAGGPADLHIWWCGISTACRRAAQGLLTRNLRILSL
jgi:hypothetical protein